MEINGHFLHTSIYIYTHTHIYMEINGHCHASGRFTSEEKTRFSNVAFYIVPKRIYMFIVILKRNGLVFTA